MGRFIFTYEGEIFDGPDKSITVEVGDNVSLDDLLNEIQNFLRSAGYYFSENSYLDIVTPDKWEQPEINDLKEWRETNWVSKPEEDLFWQKEGQQWQTNGWDETGIDGPTEFAFNGISEKDFYKDLKDNGLGLGTMRSDPLFGAVGSEKVLWDPPNTVGDYKGE